MSEGRPNQNARLLFALVAMALVAMALLLWQARKPLVAPPSSALKVAILLTGPIDDHGWNQAGYEGLRLIEKKLGAHVAYSAGVPEAERDRTFRRYATEGYQFVIGHGGEYIAAAEKVAQEFPRTNFAVVASHPGNNTNLGALSFRDGEMGYLTGVVAALKTKTRHIAFLGGMAHPHMLDQAVLFERGSKAIDPRVRVTIRWVGSWTDTQKARTIARELVTQRNDVVLVDADTGGLAAIQEFEKAGIHAIGWSVDQHALAPKTIVTSALQRVPVLLLEGAIMVEHGRWEGKQYKFGLLEGGQDLAPFYGMLGPEQERVVQSVKDDLLSGKIDASR